jgi:hypothetical protein
MPLFCAPPPMAADTRARRLADRVLPTGRGQWVFVTGTGWAALAVLIAIELAVGRSFVLGSEGLVFLAILIVGVGFEVLWRLRYGTNALVRDH